MRRNVAFGWIHEVDTECDVVCPSLDAVNARLCRVAENQFATAGIGDQVFPRSVRFDCLSGSDWLRKGQTEGLARLDHQVSCINRTRIEPVDGVSHKYRKRHAKRPSAL